MRPRWVIRIAAAVLTDADGKHLLVRKRGAEAFMQAGGKIEPRESPREALVRELVEELGLEVEPEALVPLGSYTAPAANEPDHDVVADVFHLAVPARAAVRASNEIAEIVWRDPTTDTGVLVLAPLTRMLGAVDIRL